MNKITLNKEVITLAELNEAKEMAKAEAEAEQEFLEAAEAAGAEAAAQANKIFWRL